MAAIRWVCVSDLHLGALNSVLTSVDPDGEHVDAGSASPVLEALCEALRALRGEEPPQLVVLGDLFELALSSTDDAAATFASFIEGLRPGAREGAVAPAIRFLPGNHDHHLWTQARSGHHLDRLRELPAGQALPAEAFVTPLLPAHQPVPVRDRFVEVLASRTDRSDGLTVEQSYPNLGLVGADGRRLVVLSHGHFIEPLYRAMSVLDDVFNARRPGLPAVEQLEAENGGWIDFFWSSMGDSGDVSAVVRDLYESLQSEAAIAAEIEAIRRAIRASSDSKVWSHVESMLTGKALSEAARRSMRRERHVPHVLSEQAETGLLAYLGGPVATQVAHEVGSPSEVAFIFGHTHKPFTDVRQPAGLPGPLPVVNTGGWVVDTPEAEPNKGASVVLIDDNLDVAVLRCYNQGADAGQGVRVEAPAGSGTNPLVQELSAFVDPSRDPWRALAEAATTTERDRRRQLDARLQADTSRLGDHDPSRGHHRI